MTNIGGSPAFEAFVQASAGASGGIFSTVCLMPVEVAKTRIQVSQSSETSFCSVLQKVLEEDGFSGLFRGVSVKSFEKGTETFVFFYVYEAIKRIAKERVDLTTAVSLFLGYISGVCTISVTMPMEVLSTKLQVGKRDGSSPIKILKDMFEHEGIAALYKGYWFGVLLCTNPAIQNTIFDKIKAAILLRKSRANAGKQLALSPWEALFFGGAAKAVATILTFPIVRLKTMVQAGRVPTESETPEVSGTTKKEIARSQSRKLASQSTPQLLRQMSFRHDQLPAAQNNLRRFVELYRGIGPALLKNVLQVGLMYMTKDQIVKIVVAVFKMIVMHR